MKWIELKPILNGAILVLMLLEGASSFTPCIVYNKIGIHNNVMPRSIFSLSITKESEAEVGHESETKNFSTGALFVRRGIATIVAMGVLALEISTPAYADEYGRETEALFLGTGETVMICTKRGPLGACTKTEKRTVENENDKSEKYFQQPTETKRKEMDALTAEATGEGNLLIERLKKQSEENFEKNEKLVYQRTQMNDMGASFGPFDGNVLILNEDGQGFTLLANPQAMRLKKAGFIENKKFIKQPTQEQVDAALEPEQSGPNFLDKIFGGS